MTRKVRRAHGVAYLPLGAGGGGGGSKKPPAPRPPKPPVDGVVVLRFVLAPPILMLSVSPGLSEKSFG